MNNIGGIIRCEFLPVENVQHFTVSGRTVQISLKEGKNWSKLPVSVRNTSCAAPPSADGGGTVYKHQFSSVLPTPNVSASLQRQLYQSCLTGCLLRYTDANGKQRLLGTKDYPLTGTLEEVSGTTATTLAGYRLNLTATCLTPQLICE